MTQNYFGKSVVLNKKSDDSVEMADCLQDYNGNLNHILSARSKEEEIIDPMLMDYFVI